jgi:hypothetical protein
MQIILQLGRCMGTRDMPANPHHKEAALQRIVISATEKTDHGWGKIKIAISFPIARGSYGWIAENGSTDKNHFKISNRTSFPDEEFLSS